MASYDNSRYTYEQVLAGTGYYMKDDNLVYSAGVKTMQTKLNTAGYNCGSADGKFGSNTDTAVRNFQKAYALTVDGKAGKNTLTKLDSVTSGNVIVIGTTYAVNFNTSTKQFDTNQQTVYEVLKNAGLNKIAIAGIMGNIHAESAFSTALTGDGGSGGICQWLNTRLTNLKAFAGSSSVTDINVQAKFILEECKSSSSYADSLAVKCYNYYTSASSPCTTVKIAADYFTALYERCYNQTTWEGVESACANSSWLTVSRFASDGNAYNGRFYLDTPKRRGYAQSYYEGICKM